VIRRLRSAADDVLVAARLARRLSGFFRRPLDGDAAREIVRRRLASRADDFLAMARRLFSGPAASPYRQLLQHAGCEYGDLERLVRDDGVEGALGTLFQRGVFLTVEEFKGRRPLVRGSLHVECGPAQLVNPSTSPLLVAYSSGSRGPRTEVPLDLPFVRDHAVNRRLSLEARGALAWRHAVWGAVGGSDMSIVLRFAVCGATIQRWFTPPESGRGRRPRLPDPTVLGMRWGGALAGRRLPSPRPTEFVDIARWMHQSLRAGATPHLKTYVTMALQLCEVAAAAGIELAGAQLTLTGESLTDVRHAFLSTHGARAVSDYGSNETGQLGEPCAAPDAPDDLHLMDDLHGVIQAGPAGHAHGLPPRALLVTSLRPTAPLIVINASMGDEAWLTTRSCGCGLDAAGWRRHLHGVRSFEKLQSRGRTILDTDLVHILDAVLPSRFGGAPSHYQLVEDQGPTGQLRLSVLVDPAVGPVDLAAVAEAFRQACGDPPLWREADVVRAISAPPRPTASSKILHLHREAPGPASS
jgi:hypothetical protein